MAITSTLAAHGHPTKPATITRNDRDRRAILPEEDIAAVAASEMDPGTTT